jgi:DNA invertase Pin-like site-specific DNA recombinase
MTDRLYLRASTDKQTNTRQLRALDSLLTSGAPTYEDPVTSSRVYAVDRSGFRRLLDEAAVGDTIRIADAARLFRSANDVIQIRAVLQRRGLHLHIATGAWSGFDLAGDDPQTKLFVTMLAGVLEFQRDMTAEDTREGIAAEAAGRMLRRPATLDEAQAADIIDPYTKRIGVKALAQQYDIAPRTVRGVLDAADARDVGTITREPDGMPADAEGQERTPEPEQAPTIDVPGLLAEYLKATEVPEIREALRGGRIIRHEQGHSVRVTAPLALHRAALRQCTTFARDGGTPAGRTAFRAYADQIAAVSPPWLPVATAMTWPTRASSRM